MRRFFTILAALIAFVGCSQDDVVTPNTPIEKPTYYASFADAEADSRTYLDENFMLLWHNDDRISLFATTYNEEYAFADATGSNSGAFNAVDKDSYVTGNAISTTYAVYPYDAANAISNSEILTIHFPAKQSYAEDSFGRGANTMVAAAQSSSSKLLPFRNAGGYMMLKLYGENKTVKSIEFKGNNEEVISGAATAEAKYGYLPLITMGAEGGKSITLTCQNAVELGATEAEATTFWIVVPPITFEQGFTITVTDADGGTYTKSTSKPTTINRNEIKSMAALAPTFTGETENPEIQEVPANNEIWYTTTDNQPINLDAQEDGINMFNQAAFKGVVQSHSYTDGKGVIKFDIPITQIGEGDQYTYGAPAIQMYATLKSLTLPNEIVDIADRSFVNLPALEELTLPSSLDLTQSTFRDIHSGILFRLPSLKQIKGEYATKDGRAWIKNNTMYVFAPAELTSYTVPNGVTELGDDLFHECKNLKELLLPQGLLVIGDCAIRYCSGLETLDIPQTVHTIGQCAISYCESLLELVIPKGVTRLEHDSLSGNSALTSLTLPEGITFIDSYVFSNLPQLKEIIIPSTIEQIGQCFDDSAKEIYFMSTIPPSGSVIFLNSNSYHHAETRIYVPHGCGELYRAAWPTLTDIIAEVNGPDDNEIWYTSKNRNIVEPYKTDVFGANVVSNTYENGKGIITFDGEVTKIGGEAFRECRSLTSVTIGNSVTEIGELAFYGCTSLTSVTIPDSVTEIGGYAFSSCDSLTSITIPDSVTSIGKNPFKGCNNLSEFKGKFAADNGRCLIIDGVLNSFAPAGITTYNIPDSVTSIGYYAFHECSGLTSVTIPDSVTEIGLEAFWNCSGLTSVTIPDSVTEIGFQAFHGCRSLTSITIPDSVSIGNYAFQCCRSLTSITIPDSVSIGNYAFNECSGLTSVTISDSVTSIGGNPFMRCNNLAEFKGKFAADNGRCLIIDGVLNSFAPAGLTEYTIPNSVTEIGKYAFWRCSGLTSITIPDSVTEIGKNAFCYCSGLTSITIPDSVTEIGDDAFRDCTSLKEVYCRPTTPPEGGRDMFSKNNDGSKLPIGCMIYVPASDDDGIINAYKTQIHWRNYALYIVEYEFTEQTYFYIENFAS